MKLTAAQKKRLEVLQHIKPVDTLSDGDLLCIDSDGVPKNPHDRALFGPYVMNPKGELQAITYHYTHNEHADEATT